MKNKDWIEDEWEKTFDCIADLVSIHSVDCKLIRVNKAYADVLRTKREKLLGKFCYEVFHEAKEPPLNCPHKQALRTRKPAVAKIFKPLLNRHFSVCTSPLLDKGGKVMGTVHVARDITEFAKAETAESMTELLLKYKDLVETTNDVIWETNKNGFYHYVNPSVKELLGYSFNEVLGKNIFDFMLKNDAERIERIFKEKAVNKKAFCGIENIRRRKNGQLVIFETSGVPLFDERGQLKGYSGIDKDITERKKAEMMLRISESTLKEQKTALEQKNIALKEIIEHIEREKNKIKDEVVSNVGGLLMPILEKLKTKGVVCNCEYAPEAYTAVSMLQKHLEELTASFSSAIRQKNIDLSPREVEICNMIKGGISSKEISRFMNISYLTVAKHRKNIRKKLRISHNKTSLSSYLQNI